MTSKKKIVLIVVALIVLGIGTWAVLYFSGVVGTATFGVVAIKKGTCFTVNDNDVKNVTWNKCRENKDWFSWRWDKNTQYPPLFRTGKCHVSGQPPEQIGKANFAECSAYNWDTWFADAPPLSCRVEKNNLGAGCN